ncbi:class I adenylate-forming enzyme family protein [Belnapia rosea]|uniref:class I adenylate-forming enzyme family protein n=1 Tax=Belnapia rosea TaxID=938405 RepID=UPI00087F440C|nr:class I adenylate-forming enzyme family protein [Belnapia rosea]SDB18493.1 Acyl-CoA synthetase (AMP-forming)/AMP-acid ligase II [Belnapia rosea]
MTGFRNLGALIDPAADAGKTALIDMAGGSARHVSYDDLDALSNAVARGLLRRGLQRGDRIGILATNSTEFLAALNGAMRAGLVAVPVNWRFPPATVEYVLGNSGASLVFADAARLAAVPAGLPRVELGGVEWEALLDPGPFEAVTPEPAEPALFLYTSGSTGRPKGVVLSHQSHLWVVEQRLKGADMRQERALIAAPLYHMNGLALAQLASAAHITVVLLPQFEARAYLRAIGEHRATWITGVPPMMAMLLQERDLLAATDTSSVRHVRCGSAPTSPALLAAIKAAFPQARFVNGYGTTECGPVVFGPHPDGLPTPPLSVGYPHPAVELRLNAQNVLEQKCPGMMNGYWNRPDLRPPITEDGFYVTGDVFHRDEDGFFTVVGRVDDMFISGGENIFPSEVEKVLETHPGVEQSAVIPVPDDIKGTKPVAFVVRRAGATVDEAALKSHALAHAPAYMHPRRVWFVEALPLMGTNKIDKAHLAAWARERLA